MNALAAQKDLSSRSSLLGLSPITDDQGLLRVGGRIGRAELPYDHKHPVILPSRHPLTEGIIRAFHYRHLHMGTDMVLSQLRQHYWILRGREAVKRVARECEVCVRERVKTSHQQMAEVPKERLAIYKPPFCHTAVDYFGPMEVGLSRNRTDKRYGALFTCLTTRAVYLDLAPSLSSDDFLNVLRRFIATYGTPETMHSDNGTNFVGAEKELMGQMKIMQDSGELADWSNRKGMTWKFQPPSAPHFGGAHESLVRSTKLALYRALDLEKKGLRYPTEEMLRTLLFEVAGLLNSRPLTYTSSDPEDLRPLTPNDILNRPPTAYGPTSATETDTALPKERFKYVQRLCNLFWDLWIKRYLPSLVSRSKWKQKQRDFRIGDVVLIGEPNVARGRWNLGKVTEVYPSKDGLVRVVQVKTEDGLYTRPIHRLCLLEKAPETNDGMVTNQIAQDGWSGGSVSANLKI